MKRKSVKKKRIDVNKKLYFGTSVINLRRQCVSERPGEIEKKRKEKGGKEKG